MNTYSPFGVDLFNEPITQLTDSPVAQKFLVAPFSVLSARDAMWQERKRAWVGLGIKSELGRDSGMGHSGVLHKSDTGKDWGEEYSGGDCWSGSGTSIFDPVLCELVYRWFSGPKYQVIDPFAGGSVRGVVASLMGRNYWGSDLSARQIQANGEQAQLLCSENPPQYVAGDSLETLALAPQADLVFSCPPYGDLEVYSDDPRDLSSMEWHTFIAAYKRIIMRACAKLRNDRFACFVVANFRDSRGFYRDLVGETVSAFCEQGLGLYNEAIFVTPVGTAALRVTRHFNAARKLVKVHQNILVFCKGDPKKATRALN